MNAGTIGLIAAAVVVVLLAMAAIKIVPEYERGVIFRLGRLIGAKGPGLFLIIPVVDRMFRVSLRTVTMDIPPQDVITKDNVTVRVNAVTYFNVTDPNKSVVAIEDHIKGTSEVAQTTLRSILGQVDLDELLINRDEINQRLQQIIDDLTNPWGVKVTLVEVKDVELPEGMRRAMARQAESERDRRAKVIHAKGEYEAAETLSAAAGRLEEHPASLQLRVLSTMAEMSGDRSTTVFFPFPLEFLRLAEALAPAANGESAGAPRRNGLQKSQERP
ncbi:slipin family protein [Streptomyces sp. R302]|uniref:slipin family protein n=1 Tax=unclassified Streptomyces TaxID=2593676 RepID=UPI00145FB1E9|nr:MULTISPECIES: slipin family protein [unclassified Streptomyces]NML49237.1 slipin family protein [Streptomyces sp. R301]NML77564.1 slipin family protein [Streptomyces sp. R302]